MWGLKDICLREGKAREKGKWLIYLGFYKQAWPPILWRKTYWQIQSIRPARRLWAPIQAAWIQIHDSFTYWLSHLHQGHSNYCISATTLSGIVNVLSLRFDMKIIWVNIYKELRTVLVHRNCTYTASYKICLFKVYFLGNTTICWPKNPPYFGNCHFVQYYEGWVPVGNRIEGNICERTCVERHYLLLQ